MSERDFLHPSAKQRTSEVVAAIERQTALEVVVAVRRAAAHHVGTSVALGVACGLASLLVMWFSPQVYDVWTMPLDVALSALAGTALGASVAPLQRWLTPARFLDESVEHSARAAFSELGIEKTRARTGVLVYVALFERGVVLVPDRGVPEEVVKNQLADTRAALRAAVGRGDLDAFLVALARLGPVGAAVLPRQAGDENELCDHVV